MANAAGPSPHTFHIPVMGTGFMIDAPLRVAKYGISSVISLVDDVLIEQMRRYHCEKNGEPYEEIGNTRRRRTCPAHHGLSEPAGSPGPPAGRAAASVAVRAGSEITRYYELLPESPLRQAYREMLATADGPQRRQLQDRLRRRAVPGSIDVNIMSKGDRDLYRNGEKLPAKYSDASAALRGFAESTLASSIVFSAGINPRLYSYAAEFDDFFPDEDGVLKKKIILKVSDYHSAEIQGRFFAKRGLWVSEYRVESGLNCGGHTFATKGLLLGPILERVRAEEAGTCRHDCTPPASRPWPSTAERPTSAPRLPHHRARRHRHRRRRPPAPRALRRRRHRLGHPVPAGARGDERRRRASSQTVCEASDGDVYLSDSSPFGLPFWNLRTSASENARRRRIAEGRPGSPCIEGLRQTVQHRVHAAADLHRLAPVPAAEARTARCTRI